MSTPETTGYAQIVERPSVLTTPMSELTMLADLRMMPFRERIRKASQEQFDSHPDLFVPPKIYIASKADHRPRWRELKENRGFNIISRWIYTDDRFSVDPTDLDYTKLWKECIEDVQACDTLVLYVEPGERLKGALVELGAALGSNKEVIVTGDVGDNGTWWHNKKIQVSDKNVEQVLTYLYGQES